MQQSRGNQLEVRLWRRTALTESLGLALPIIAAPMAGSRPSPPRPTSPTPEISAGNAVSDGDLDVGRWPLLVVP